jgi:hypothetical protein
MKQCCRDLYVINYRLWGLAGKKFKIQKIVLANTEKFRVRSEKFYGGAGLRRCNRSRGSSAKRPRHRNSSKGYQIFQGPNRKTFTAQHPWRRRVV